MSKAENNQLLLFLTYSFIATDIGFEWRELVSSLSVFVFDVSSKMADEFGIEELLKTGVNGTMLYFIGFV